MVEYWSPSQLQCSEELAAVSDIIEEPRMVIDLFGTQKWWLGRKLHRLDGPALIADDEQSWWVDGKLHRVDAPARIWADGEQQWWIGDKHITNQVEAWMDQLGLPPWEQWGDTEKTLFKITFTQPTI